MTRIGVDESRSGRLATAGADLPSWFYGHLVGESTVPAMRGKCAPLVGPDAPPDPPGQLPPPYPRVGESELTRFVSRSPIYLCRSTGSPEEVRSPGGTPAADPGERVGAESNRANVGLTSSL